MISQRIEGKLTGKIKIIGNLSDPLRGNTEISLDLTDGRVKLLNPFLGMDRVEFRKISFSGVLDNRRLNIKELNMRGGPVSGSAKGSVVIGNVVLNSRLNLRAEIEPSPSLAQEMPEVGRAIDLMKSKMKNGKLQLDIMGTFNRPLPKFR